MSPVVDVAIGILVETRGGATQMLIARRKQDAVLGGYWELPGGKIEPGETPDQCVVREFEEELGVAVAAQQTLDVIEFEYPHARVRLHPFFCTRVSGQPVNRHVAEHRWIGADELLRYEFPPANAELMRKVHAMLTAAGNGS